MNIFHLIENFKEKAEVIAEHLINVFDLFPSEIPLQAEN